MSGDLIPIIQQAIESQNVDTEKLKQLLDIQMSILDRDAKQAFSASMKACQSELPLITKNAVNKQTNSKYAKHELICKEIKPVYTKHGFSLSFHEGEASKEGYMRIICDVEHELGHSKQYHMDLPLDDRGIKDNVNKTQIHAKGSTFSYGRRYLTMMIFDLATYDDDDASMGNVISEEMVNKLHAMINENKLDSGPILAYIKSLCGANSLNEIPEKYYDRIIIAIQRKIKANDKN